MIFDRKVPYGKFTVQSSIAKPMNVERVAQQRATPETFSEAATV